ncbi:MULTISPECIES: ATP-binding cassette domain-containing protein [Actinosynnema]|uniref:ATP-binding cassette domain-containing protein n=1 Tax=Actinosynnema TaxID=40566 RepID=UPI0020A52FF5|nr:ATP-binding cassette domain-containing protein [Actinosynnema pretiosum]MCP2092500.1 peptide/nickel transport system ATP-binding protein [Actinosynnema pretiosum]
MTPLLSVEDLVVDYGGLRAVDGVSFSVAAGSTLAVVGESGCGKSTVANAIMRLVTPTSGRVVLEGTDIARLPERKLRPLRPRFQMVFQDPYGSLDPHLTAERIVAEPLGHLPRAERVKEAARLLDLVRLPSGVAERRPSELSGGQRQRVGIARAIATSPKLLVCDEATSALDVSVQATVLKLLADLQAEQGLAYVFISHNLGVVREISQEVVVMRAGRVVESGPTAQVLASPSHEYTRALRRAALDPTTMRGVKPREHVRAAGGAR